MTSTPASFRHLWCLKIPTLWIFRIRVSRFVRVVRRGCRSGPVLGLHLIVLLLDGYQSVPVLSLAN